MTGQPVSFTGVTEPGKAQGSQVGIFPSCELCHKISLFIGKEKTCISVFPPMSLVKINLNSKTPEIPREKKKIGKEIENFWRDNNKHLPSNLS